MAKNDPLMVTGTTCLVQNAPSVNGHYRYEDNQVNLSGRNIYYWYYATQVMHNQPGPAWDKWNRKIRRVLIETQVSGGCANGSWDPNSPTKDTWGIDGGRLMVTSLSALTLEVYYRYLPLYQLDTAAPGGSTTAEPDHAGAGDKPKSDAAKPKPKGRKRSQYPTKDVRSGSNAKDKTAKDK
jgi:hypothetical protein